MLEPYEGKLSRTVLRGERDSNIPDLLDSLIENKQKFIGQIMTSKSPARSADDVDATALSYAEVKALATGDNRIKEKMDLDIQVAKLKLMRANHAGQQYEMEDKLLKYYPQEMKKTGERIDGMSKDYKTIQAHPVADDSFSMILQGKLYTERKKAGEVIIAFCKKMKNPEEKMALGEYRGFPMTLYIDNGMFKISMKQNLSYTAELESNVLGNITRINHALESMPKSVESLKARLENLQTEMDSAKEEVARPFPKEEEYQERSARLTQLNIELNNTANEEISEKQEKVDAPKKSATMPTTFDKKPSILGQLREYTNAQKEPVVSEQNKGWVKGVII